MKLEINGQVLDVEVADTLQSRQKGLIGTEEVPKDGLLLVFPENDEINIHTISMSYPIDVIFVSHGKIRSIHPLMPDNRVSDFGDMVLEMELGEAERRNIQVGMKVNKKKIASRKEVASLKHGGVIPKGTIEIIGKGGEVIKSLDDDIRIVSRVETKKLFELATKKSDLELGRFMVKVINGQDRRPKQTVKVK